MSYSGGLISDLQRTVERVEDSVRLAKIRSLINQTEDRARLRLLNKAFWREFFRVMEIEP